MRKSNRNRPKLDKDRNLTS